MDKIEDFILTRESCRNYKEEKIELDLLVKIAKLSLLSPSACNSQPWKIHIVHKDEEVNITKEACMYNGFNKFVKNVNQFFIIEETPANVTEKFGMRMLHQDFTSLDIGILSAHLILISHKFNLATCMMGMFNEKKLQEMLNTKNRLRLVIAIGKTNDLNTRKKVRKEIDKTLNVIGE